MAIRRRHTYIDVKALGDLVFSPEMRHDLSTVQERLLLGVYRYFSKHCFACMCEISIWKIPISWCAGLAPAINDHWPGVGATCLLAWCRTEAEASELAQVGHRSDRCLLMFAVCKRKVASLSSWSKWNTLQEAVVSKCGNCFGSQTENCFEPCCENVVLTSKVTHKSSLCNNNIYECPCR